jgi:uncharacterized protein (TIGR02271 family)
MVDLPNGSANAAVDPTLVETSADATREAVIPLFEEKLSVSKRVVPTSRVQVSRVTHSHEQLVDELLNHERVEIERIPIDKPVDALPSIREEGDSLVIPVVEEVVKVERYLLLKEEVRVRRVRATERYQESVTLRKQEAVVTRLPIANPAASLAETQTDLTSDKKEKQTHEL